MGLLERGGRAVLTVARNVKRRVVDGLMGLVGASSVVNTDDFPVYMHVGGDGWDHRIVNHSLGEYARGDDHTNTMEGLFQDLGHWLDTFKGVCKRNLQLFVSMFQFNYNHRGLKSMDRFTELLRAMLYTTSGT